jgi:hypothetical protein
MADRTLPLQNRVTPEGRIVAEPARGTMMGNRGGAFHNPDKTLAKRRWKTKAWICCVLRFKGRRREVMAPNRYTELFFLDEATALSAGHRPCFECRRHDALRFAELWRTTHGLQQRPRVADMDKVLHAERTRANGEVPRRRATELPDGAFVAWEGRPHLVLAGRLRPWTLDGYGRSIDPPDTQVELLTPPAIVAVLSAGYQPILHPSAQFISGLFG